MSALSLGPTPARGGWRRWLPLPFNLALVAMLAWQLADVALELAGTDAPRAAPASAAPVPAPTPRPAIAPQRLQGLFGRADAQKAQPDRSKAPETRLALTLRGIFATEKEEHGIALIQHPDGREKHFRRGAEVFGLATLDAIKVDHVILLRDGEYEILRLPKLSLGLAREPELARKRGETFAQLRKDFLSGNIMKLVHLVGADTAYDERGFIGFKLVALSDEGKALLEELGLADGDIVTHIDGQEIAQSIQSVKETIAKLRDGPLNTVTIVRQGTPLEIPVIMPGEQEAQAGADS